MSVLNWVTITSGWQLGLILMPLALVHADDAKAPQLVIRGEAETELAPHRQGNVYAPDVHRDGDRWLMWYGGQGRDGHDRIHLAESKDGKSWTKRGVVIDNGRNNHVNDPSVVKVGQQWWMFYTVADVDINDQIAAASSSDGLVWQLHGVVLGRGAVDAWDSSKVGRPSVLYEAGLFRMWYDGQPTSEAVKNGPALNKTVSEQGRAMGYAESRDGLTWQRRAEPVCYLGAGAAHVAHGQNQYVMVFESGSGTLWASSPDGLQWQAKGMLQAISQTPLDAYGQVTPFLYSDSQTTRLFFGAAARRTWDGNAIAALDISWPE